MRNLAGVKPVRIPSVCKLFQFVIDMSFFGLCGTSVTSELLFSASAPVIVSR